MTYVNTEWKEKMYLELLNAYSSKVAYTKFIVT